MNHERLCREALHAQRPGINVPATNLLSGLHKHFKLTGGAAVTNEA
jgi:hypothetical protein